MCARREEWLTPAITELRGRGFTVEGMTCDVADPAQVQAVVDKTVATCDRLDILVNNAGVTWAAPPQDLPLDKWQKVIDINLTGAFLFSQAAREMLKVIRRHHQRGVNCRPDCLGQWTPLRGIRGEQGGVDGPHEGICR